MKPSIITLLFFSLACTAFSQQSDFIILKKKNNRTVRTYAAGTFISAKMNNDFEVHGYITAIRNDSIYVRQQDIQLIGKQFGMELDTVFYTVGFDYHQILRYHIKDGDMYGRPTGLQSVTIPRILMAAGAGFILLETVNTLYRKESFSDNGKIVSLGIAAGIAAAGYFWNKEKNKREKRQNKLNVIYVKAGSIFK